MATYRATSRLSHSGPQNTPLAIPSAFARTSSMCRSLPSPSQLGYGAAILGIIFQQVDLLDTDTFPCPFV